MSHRKTKKEFIKNAYKIHGPIYDYSLVEYISNKHPIIIICKKHGKFTLKPNTHLNKKKKHGCPKCGVEICAQKRTLTKEELIKRAKKLFPFYDYSKVEQPKNTKEKVEIGCQKHGFFRRTFNALLRGQGCPKCGILKSGETRSLTQDEYIKRCLEKHKKRYDYSLCVYSRLEHQIKIICPIHGIFTQTAKNHLSGAGCKKCALEETGKKKRDKIRKSLIKRFRETHGYRYDYSQVKYISSNIKIKIVCKKHGLFLQSPIHHRRGSGCPICRRSKGEAAVAKNLNMRKVKYIRNKCFKDCRDKLPLPFDFYLPAYNTCIEYDGELHYKKFEKSFNGKLKLDITKKHDKMKTQYCKDKNIKLIRIPYWEKNNITEILKNFLHRL